MLDRIDCSRCYLDAIRRILQHLSSTFAQGREMSCGDSGTNSAGRNRGRSQWRQNDPQGSGIRFYLYLKILRKEIN
jgi:hypothetical protein